MNHKVEFAFFRDRGVVHLDFISLRESHRGSGKQTESDPSEHEVNISLKEFHVAHGLPVGSVFIPQHKTSSCNG
jgi:hypothetical protein